MASGINGPGSAGFDRELPEAETPLLEVARHETFSSFTASDAFRNNNQGNNNQGRPVEEVNHSIEANHLSFTNLMTESHSGHNIPAQPASGIRRMPGSEHSLARSIDPSGYTSNWNVDLSLNHEIHKVFDIEAPSHLELDFSDPANSSYDPDTYPLQRYTEGDYSLRRHSHVHMSLPMATHLSSSELKTIQYAHSDQHRQPAKFKESNHRRRHRSSSSSSGSGTRHGISRSSGQAEGEKKHRKKKEKKTKKKRKSLTAPMRGRTMSIPEEDEDETDDQEDEAIEDSDFVEDDKDDEDDDGANLHSSHKSRTNDQPENGADCNQFMSEETGSRIDDGRSGMQSSKKMAVFTLGGEDPPFPSGGKPQLSDSLSFELEVDVQNTASSCDEDVKASNSGAAAAENGNEQDQGKDAERKRKKKSRRHHHHHHRKHKHDDVFQRKMSGHRRKEMDAAHKPKGTTVGEDEVLRDADHDEIQSHRYENRLGLRKHLLHRPVKPRKLRTVIKEQHDRNPHEIFVELDELIDGGWKETARWIKFEEDVEESQTWSKPHVASLSFHSLLELRKAIEKGSMMLDLKSKTIGDVIRSIVDELVKTDQIRREDAVHVEKLLLSEHRHMPPQHSFPYNLSQAGGIGGLLSSNSFRVDQHQVHKMNPDDDVEVRFKKHDSEVSATGKRKSGSQHMAEGLSRANLKIMKKIPPNAEAAGIFVGCVEFLQKPAVAFIRLAQGTQLDNVVSLPIPTRFAFVLLGPPRDDYDYHEVGRSISTLMADQEFRVMAYSAESKADILHAINEFLDDSIVLPPGQLENPELLRNISSYQKGLARQRDRKKNEKEKLSESVQPSREKDPLKRTGKPFGGLLNDVKRRYPLYLSDILDGLNVQCFASIIFIYFAALSPAITFGGLLGEKTGNLMGASEMLLGCCIGGVAYGLFSGQPLLIAGSTGPLLVFEEAVYEFCKSSNVDFLATRVWIGLWIAFTSVVIVAFEGSFLVRFVSRFTQEIFSTLISCIFIFETFNKLAKTFKDHPLLASYPSGEAAGSNFSINEYLRNQFNCTIANSTFANSSLISNSSAILPDSVELNQPNTALLSTILMFGTFIIAYFLRQFKNSKFLRSSARRTIGDFGVPIAIGIMVLCDYLIKDTYTQKLDVPAGISPTDTNKRSWLINPFGNVAYGQDPLPLWVPFAAVIPALLVFVLIFMESHITEMIVSKKEQKLKKGTGFHLDILTLGSLNAVLSLFGMPWICAAAVRSITHTNSLTIMSTTQAPGESAKVVGLHEQRVTVVVVNALLGLSILMQSLLSEIPLSVLFGIFLYMGVTSLTGVQMVDRVMLMFMPSKNYPDYSYVKMVRPHRIHIFTAIQILCLVVLWLVKSTAAKIAFPFFLVLTIPLRHFVLSRFFTPKELRELDSSDSKTTSENSNDDAAKMPPEYNKC